MSCIKFKKANIFVTMVSSRICQAAFNFSHGNKITVNICAKYILGAKTLLFNKLTAFSTPEPMFHRVSGFQNEGSRTQTCAEEKSSGVENEPTTNRFKLAFIILINFGLRSKQLIISSHFLRQFLRLSV